MTSISTQAGQFATFRVAAHWFGIGVLDVQEVMSEQELTPVPLAPGAMAGLINLRGQIVPALEMRKVLGLPARDGSFMSVVLRTGRGTLSLLVDEIGDVLELDASSFELPPRNLEPRLRTLLAGVHKLQDRLLLVLDMAQDFLPVPDGH